MVRKKALQSFKGRVIQLACSRTEGFEAGREYCLRASRIDLHQSGQHAQVLWIMLCIPASSLWLMKRSAEQSELHGLSAPCQ